MTKRFIELDVVCSDSKSCMDDIVQAVNNIAPQSDGLGNFYGHVSVQHTPNNHQIWIFYYDNDGEHEQDGYQSEDYKVNNSAKYVEVQTTLDKEATLAKINTELAKPENQNKRPSQLFNQYRQTKQIGIFKQIQKSPNPKIKASPTKPTKANLQAGIRTKLQQNPNVEIV